MNSLTALASRDEAVRYLREADQSSSVPDLIVLDLDLPDDDGGTLIRELRDHARWSGIPIIGLAGPSADLSDVARTYGLMKGCCLRKPVEVSDLQKAIRLLKDCWMAIVRRPDS